MKDGRLDPKTNASGIKDTEEEWLDDEADWLDE